MTPFDNALEKLEFEKIRQRIVRYAVSDPGRELLSVLDVRTAGWSAVRKR